MQDDHATPPSMPPVPQAGPLPTSEEKLWMILSHLSPLLGVGLILPLVIYLVKKDVSPLIADHAREALNFQITILIYSAACVLLAMVLIGFLLMFAVIIGSIVFAIIGAVKASEGLLYRYPLTLRFVN